VLMICCRSSRCRPLVQNLSALRTMCCIYIDFIPNKQNEHFNAKVRLLVLIVYSVENVTCLCRLMAAFLSPVIEQAAIHVRNFSITSVLLFYSFRYNFFVAANENSFM
jgi:hypothetical protein